MKIDREKHVIIFAPDDEGRGGRLCTDTVHEIIAAAVRSGFKDVWIGWGWEQGLRCSVGLGNGDHAREFASQDSLHSLQSGWFLQWSDYSEPDDEAIMMLQMLLPRGV